MWSVLLFKKQKCTCTQTTMPSTSTKIPYVHGAHTALLHTDSHVRFFASNAPCFTLSSSSFCCFRFISMLLPYLAISKTLHECDNHSDDYLVATME